MSECLCVGVLEFVYACVGECLWDFMLMVGVFYYVLCVGVQDCVFFLMSLFF